MKRHPPLLLLTLLPLAACTTPRYVERPPIPYEITLIDRNNDGLADKKRFHAPGIADVDYDLLDTDYDGAYDQKITYGYALIKTRVQIPAEPMPGK